MCVVTSVTSVASDQCDQEPGVSKTGTKCTIVTEMWNVRMSIPNGLYSAYLMNRQRQNYAKYITFFVSAWTRIALK